MSDFLFENKTEKDMEDLEGIIAEEEETSYEENRFSLDKEVAFHGKLYRMSGNTNLIGFQNLLLPVFEYKYLQ